MFEQILKWLRTVFNQMFQQGVGADIVLSDKMSSAIDLWARMYEDGGPWCGKAAGIHSLRLPASIASEFARLITIEMSIELSGGARAEYLQRQLSPLLRDIRRPVEVACALGGAVFKPYVTAAGGLAIDVVQGDAFLPTSFDTSNRMTGGIFVEQIKRADAIYTRAEHHDYKSGTHSIENRAFMSRSGVSLGSPISLTDVPEWAGIAPEASIANVDRPLFGYFRVPCANRRDRHSPLGSSVYAEAVETIRDADEQYGRYLWEFDGGQLAVDLDEEMFGHRLDGAVSVPRLEQRLYRRRKSAMSENTKTFYEVFAPQLRDENYRSGLNTILQRIEFQCGLAYGTLSNPQDTEKTATEIINSKQRSYSTVRDIQLALQNSFNDLLYAMDKLTTLYKLAPEGTYTAAFDWDDSIVNDPNQRKQMYWSYVMAGKFPMWRYLMEFENYTEADAKAIQAEAAQGSGLDNPFGFDQGGGGA